MSTQNSYYEGYLSNGSLTKNGVTINTDAKFTTEWNTQLGGASSLTQLEGELAKLSNGKLATIDEAQVWLESIATKTASYRGFYSKAPQPKVPASNSFRYEFNSVPK
jgi:hypothetical protein